jgi:hypothetical protein
MRIKSILSIKAISAWTIVALIVAHLITRFVWASSVRTQGPCETYNYEPGVAITVGNFHTCEPGLLKENALWYNFWNLPGINPMEFVLVHLAATGLIMYVVFICVAAWKTYIVKRSSSH